MAIRTRPAVGGGQQLSGHGRPGPALDARRGQRQVLGHRPAAGRAVAVQVLQAHQQRAGAFGGGQHPPLQRREPLRPLVVRGVQALVDHRCALGRVGGGFGVGGIGGPPVDPGQRGRPVPGHRPDGDTQPGQVRGQGIADLAGPENHVQLILTHGPAPRRIALCCVIAVFLPCMPALRPARFRRPAQVSSAPPPLEYALSS